jgi:ribosomal-protein-serine acetyltransferase
MERADPSRLPDHFAGPRLAIRRHVVADATTLGAAVAANVEHLRPYMAWVVHEPLSTWQRRELIAGWEREWLDGGDVYLGAYLAGRLVGCTGLHRRLGPDALEIGYWVDHRHVRRGYATEMSRVLVDAAFALDGIDHVEIHHDVTNVASEGVPRALGFEDLGEIESAREHPAPAECGTDRAWRVTRERWAMMRA